MLECLQRLPSFSPSVPQGGEAANIKISGVRSGHQSGDKMKDKLSSASLALCALFLIMAVSRAGSGSDSLWLTWPVYGLIAAFFGLLTALLRWLVHREEEIDTILEERQAEHEAKLREMISDPDRSYRISIRNAEPTGEPGRYRCDIEITEDPLHQDDSG